MFNWFKKAPLQSKLNIIYADTAPQPIQIPLDYYQYVFTCNVHCPSGEVYTHKYESDPFHNELTLEDVINYTMRADYIVCNEGVVPNHNIKFITNLTYNSEMV